MRCVVKEGYECLSAGVGFGLKELSTLGRTRDFLAILDVQEGEV